MRRTITLLATTLVVAAAITGSASAAALYTNSAHTTLVPVGPTSIGATDINNYQITRTNGSFFDSCGQASLSLKLTQNSGGVVKFAITSRQLNSCIAVWNPQPTGTLQISGSSITVGSTKAWTSTTLTGTVLGSGNTYTENFVSATGNPPVNGVFAQQPTSGASPVKIVLNHAPSFTGPSLSATVTGSYTFSGPAGSYSLG
jgi:hypothetical protein